MSGSTTAAYTAAFTIKTPEYGRGSAHAARVAERYVNWFGVRRSGTWSDTKVKASVPGPTLIVPQWAATMHDRLYASVVPKGREEENDGRWLSPHVVETASAFFHATADTLPNEPYIYGSDTGDLIAEFREKHGTMTSILTPTGLVLFVVVDKRTPIEKKYEFDKESPATLREELQQLTEMLRTGLHGAVDTPRNHK